MENSDHVAVPIKLLLVMQTSDNMHLRTAIVDRFLSSAEDIVITHDVPFGAPKIGAEGTEVTTIDADVGGIQMGVDVVVGIIAVDPLTNQIRELSYLIERNLWLVKEQTIFRVQSFPCLDFVADALQLGMDRGDHC